MLVLKNDIFPNLLQILKVFISFQFLQKKIVHLERDVEQSESERNCRNEELDTMRVEFQTLKQLYTQLKPCCDPEAKSVNEEEIRQQADKVFAGYFGDSVSKNDVVRIFQIMNSKIQQDDLQGSTSSVRVNADLGTDEIRKIVLGILKIYDADKTGRVDYALESAGMYFKIINF